MHVKQLWQRSTQRIVLSALIMTPGARTQGYHMPHLQLIRYTIWYNISYQGRGVEAGYPEVREDIQGLIKSAMGR